MVQSSQTSDGSNPARILLPIVLAFLLPLLSGCRFMVAAGKMVLGDPINTSTFEFKTGISLRDSGDPLLIVCTAPHRTLSKFPAIQLEIVERISRNLEAQEVNVVSPDDVATWFDDRGEWGDFSELADHFDAPYVLHVDLRSFTYLEPASPDLMRGRSEGTVKVFRFGDDSSGMQDAVFEQNLKVNFPETYPVPRESGSVEHFVDNLLDRISLQVSQMLYDHRLRDTIF